VHLALLILTIFRSFLPIFLGFAPIAVCDLSVFLLPNRSPLWSRSRRKFQICFLSPLPAQSPLEICLARECIQLVQRLPPGAALESSLSSRTSARGQAPGRLHDSTEVPSARAGPFSLRRGLQQQAERRHRPDTHKGRPLFRTGPEVREPRRDRQRRGG